MPPSQLRLCGLRGQRSQVPTGHLRVVGSDPSERMNGSGGWSRRHQEGAPLYKPSRWSSSGPQPKLRVNASDALGSASAPTCDVTWTSGRTNSEALELGGGYTSRGGYRARLNSKRTGIFPRLKLRVRAPSPALEYQYLKRRCHTPRGTAVSLTRPIASAATGPFAVYRRRDTGRSVASRLWSPTVRQRHIQDGRPESPQCVAIMSSKPPRASAMPATIILSLGILKAGICAATNQTPANKIKRNPTSTRVTPV